MSKWVVIGAAGMLGTDLVQLLHESGEQVTGFDSAQCDIRELDQVRDAVREAEVVVNAAAYTAVDKAEEQEALAFAVNAVGARNVALAAAEVGARMVQVSTDYVFDGTASSPYQPDAPQNPKSAYGRTKAAGEWAVRASNPDALIVRTAWLYGEHGPNFVRTMLRLAAERETLTVVDDQIGQPTWTGHLAARIRDLVAAQLPGGYYHGTSSGQVSWCGFAREIFRCCDLDPQRVQAITTEQYPTPAVRPAYSVLAHESAQPDWRLGLNEYLARIGSAG